MKIKCFLLAVLMILAFSFAACNEPQQKPENTGSSSGGSELTEQEVVLSTDIPTVASEPTIQIHYRRNSAKDYLKWGFLDLGRR